MQRTQILPIKLLIVFMHVLDCAFHWVFFSKIKTFLGMPRMRFCDISRSLVTISDNIKLTNDGFPVYLFVGLCILLHCLIREHVLVLTFFAEIWHVHQVSQKKFLSKFSTYCLDMFGHAVSTRCFTIEIHMLPRLVG